MARMARYFSVLIPYVAKNATPWHPTEPEGPFSVLTRGAFATKEEAHMWAAKHIEGHPYGISEYEYPVEA